MTKLAQIFQAANAARNEHIATSAERTMSARTRRRLSMKARNVTRETKSAHAYAHAV